MTCARVSSAVAARNGGPAGQELVEDRPQGVDVGRRRRPVRVAPRPAPAPCSWASRGPSGSGSGRCRSRGSWPGRNRRSWAGRRPSSRTLAGFRSRWTIPLPWASAMAPGQHLDQPAAFAAGQRGAVELPVQAAAGQVFQLEEGQAARLADVVDLHDAGCRRRATASASARNRAAAAEPACGAGQDHLQAQGRFSATLRAR